MQLYSVHEEKLDYTFFDSGSTYIVSESPNLFRHWFFIVSAITRYNNVDNKIDTS